MMTKSMISRALGLLLGAVATSTCAQPDPLCTSAQGDYVVRYMPTEPAAGACATLGLTVELVGAATYLGNNGGKPDETDGSIALRSETMGVAVRAADNAELLTPEQVLMANALGDFSSEKADSNQICSVPTLSPAAVTLPVVPADPGDPENPDDDVPEQPAQSISYTWSNVQIYNGVDALGAQFSADLSFDITVTPTGGAPENCVATYRAWGLFPEVGCQTTEDCEAAGTFPGQAVECEPVAGLCVVAAEPPSFQ